MDDTITDGRGAASVDDRVVKEKPVVVSDDEAAKEKKGDSQKPSCRRRALTFYWEHELLILILVAIALAKVYPPLGAVYLQPDITAKWVAVVIIFVLAGIGLKTEELKKSFFNVKFNVVVQVFSFGVVSSLVYGVSRGLAALNILSQDLADGMVVCASLPLAPNLVIVLTKAARGDEAEAIFNATVGNLIGIFLSPVLILGYLGVTGDAALIDVFYKLTLAVLLPVIAGQFLQRISAVHDFVKRHKDALKRAQQYCLVFIVYTVFCKTFLDGPDSSIADIFLMICFQFLLLTTVMVMAWYMLKTLFHDEPKLRVMGLFGCTQKTIALGVPLINAVYEDNPAVGLYTLPLLIWHPLQLILGTLLAPRLAAFVQREQDRFGIAAVEDEDYDDINDPRETPAAVTDEGSISDDVEASLSSVKA